MIFRPKNKMLALIVRAAELCLVAFDTLFFALMKTVPRSRSNNVLLVRLDAIGDFVLWLAAAKALRHHYSQHHVLLVGNSVWANLAKELSWFDSVISIDRKRFLMNPWYRCRMLWNIRQAGAELAINTVFHRDFLVSDTVIRASGAKTRAGLSGDIENSTPWQKKIGDSWYTTLANTAPKHQLEEDADLLRSLGITYSAALPVLPKFPLSTDFPITTYYVINPGAGHEMREWPVGRFREIAQRIHARTGMTGVLCGGKRETGIARSFLEGMGAPMTDMVGKTTLLELAAIIANAKLLVGNDTGAIHIAVATSTPAVCILGGAHPGRYIPYPAALNARLKTVMHPMDCFQCDWHCVHEHTGVVPCINAISVDDVWKAVEACIEGK